MLICIHSNILHYMHTNMLEWQVPTHFTIRVRSIKLKKCYKIFPSVQSCWKSEFAVNFLRRDYTEALSSASICLIKWQFFSQAQQTLNSPELSFVLFLSMLRSEQKLDDERNWELGSSLETRQWGYFRNCQSYCWGNLSF